MTSEPVFLDVDEVLLIHDEQLAGFGGGAGIRDRGGLGFAERRLDKHGFAALLERLVTAR